MNLIRFLTYPCIVVLLLLINSISVSFSVPQFSAGFLSEVENITHLYKLSDYSSVLLASEAHKNSNTILFVGDVLLARNVEFLMQNKGESYPYQGVDFSSLAANPYIVGNFESSIPKIHIPTKAYGMVFSVNPVFLTDLQQAGFTHLSLANNHSYDYGLDGYKYAVSELNQKEITTFGSPENSSSSSVSYVSVGEQTVALIGLYAVVSPPSADEIKTIFNAAKNNSDFQVVFIHWGEEYKVKNNQSQKVLATKLVAAGADIIIGHHPHVVQNIDLIDGVPVFYSLGNYIFDQYFSVNTQTGLLLQLEFGNQPKIHIVPVTSLGTLSQPHFMSETDHYNFLSNLSQRSHLQLQAGIAKGEIPLDSWVATSSKIAMMD